MTEAQVAALEQWAWKHQCGAQHCTKYDCSRYAEVVALCETVRAQGAALRDGVRENWAMQQERDAAVARAEQAEREREGLRAPCLCCSEVTQPCQHGCQCSVAPVETQECRLTVEVE